MTCKEIVIYEVSGSDQPAYLALRGQVLAEVRKRFAGLVSVEISRSAENPELLVDCWEWDTQKNARAAYVGFSTCPGASELVKYIRKGVFSGLFNCIELQNVAL